MILEREKSSYFFLFLITAIILLSTLEVLRMHSHERQKKILTALQEHSVCKVNDFFEMFPKFSESTVRRDLRILESANKIITFYGGDIMLKRKIYEDKYEQKLRDMPSDTVDIAKHAAGMIKNGYCVYLDASTTVLSILPFINKDIIIVTNSVRYDFFEEYAFTPIFIGGKARLGTSYACFDSIAKEMISKMNFDLAFVGCGGITKQQGITYPTIEHAIYQRQLKKQAKEYIILADERKFNNSFFGRSFEIDECEILTDNIPPAYKKYKNIKAVKIQQ